MTTNNVFLFPDNFSKLLVPGHLLDVSKINSKYLILRRNAIKLEDDFFDVVIGGGEDLSSLGNKSLDYLIPIHKMKTSAFDTNRYTDEAFRSAIDEYEKSNFRRHYMRSLAGGSDCLVEIQQSEPVTPVYSTIHLITSYNYLNLDLEDIISLEKLFDS